MVIGIDVGGTKTKAVLFDENGQIVKEVVTGSAHPMNSDDASIIKSLRECLLDDTSELVFGYAGYGKNAEMRQHIQNLVETVCKDRNHVLLNDIEMALLSTLGMKDGICVILGTGSIALKRKGTDLERRGGWGYVLGDEGSGYALGREILRLFTKQADHRGTPSYLYQEIMKMYELKDPSDLIAKIMTNGAVNRTAVAKCAVLCDRKETFEEVYPIMKEQAIQTAQMINSFREKGMPVVITGGMTHNSAYMSVLRDYLKNFDIAEHEPVYGAYVYAQNHFCNKRK